MYEPRQVPLGKNCGCVCPACSVPLYAKHCLSGKRVPHFAHAPGADCAAGAETAIHLAAKQLIQERKVFFFPSLVASVEEVDVLLGVHRASKELYPAGRHQLLQVTLESSISAIRPDALVKAVDYGSVAIEIAVTHFSDAAKRAAFAELSLPAIEVDLSGVRDATFQLLEKLLFEDGARSTWIYHPNVAKAEVELRDSLQERLAQGHDRRVLEQQQRQEKRTQEEALRRHQEREALRRSIRAKIEREEAEAAQHQRDQARRERTVYFRAASEELKRSILQTWLNAPELPANLQVKSRFRDAFGMRDPHVWQTAFFMGLIHRRPAKGMFLLTVDTATEWMRQRFDSPLSMHDRDDLALREYMFALVSKEALLAQRQGFFYTGVADLASFDALLELRNYAGQDSTAFASRLAWAEPCEWPDANQPTVIALVMSRAPSLTGPWAKLSTIGTGARRFKPSEVCQWGASLGLDEATTLEYLVRAGYVRFVRETL